MIKYDPRTSDTVIDYRVFENMKKREWSRMMRKIYDEMESGRVDWLWVQRY